MVLYYYPSDLFLHQNNLISVAFKTCQLLNSTNTIGCKYELNRLVKFSWSKLQNVDKPLQAALRNFRLTEEDFVKLIKIYETHQDDKSYREMACMWMRENSNIWKTWKIGSDRFIYIGGIFPLTGSTYHGAGIIRGALLAKDIINENRTILPDYKLVISVSDGKCRADNVMKSFIDYIVDSYYHQLIGVLGPACSETVEPLAGVSKHFKILIISYSAEGASYSDKEKYPYFFRTIGENNNYMHVYLNFFKRMGWARIASLTEDGQRYTEYISHMQNLLEENQISFISNTKFPRERKHSIIIMRRYLEDLKKKRARIIIVDVYDHIARTVMCEAFHLQMTPSNGYVWFLPTWLNTSWYDVDYYKTEFKEEINCSTIDIIKVVNGYFSMTHVYYAPDNTEIVGNLSVAEWKRRYKEKSTNVAKEGTSNYAGFAYDAVWVYALALDKLTRMDPEALSDLHSTNTTKKLVKLVEETDFMGVSGRIKFHGGPSRFSVINIMQWYNNETHIIGQFTPNLTGNKPIIFGGHLQLNTSSIKWFTKDGKKPGDGMLPPLVCTLESLAKFFGTNCETAFIILDVMIGLLLLFIVVVAIVFIKKRYDKKVKNTRDYLRQLGIDFNPANFDGLDKWEIKRECVIINRKLGEGAFGTVYGGEADLPDKGWIPVAVKTLKPGSSCDDKLSFLSEAEVMKRFNHENIVRLLGVCMKDEPIYTIMEYMLYGDLKTYLLARRHLANDEDSEVSSAKLTGMALDVAKALYYLAQLNFVHRDVASRNCLVNTHRVVKLGDFGMTRAMVESDYYKFTRKGMLPVRWMPPESLREGKFSPASDIWSFGVLIYEIITFGSFPFQGYSNQQVLELVKKGKTITIPLGISSRLKGLLKLCWDRDPANRITASALVEELTNNPRLLSACTHLPRSFTQIDNIDKVEVRTPNDSLSRNHSTIPNGIGIGHEIHYDPRSVPDSGIDLSSDISRQPLLERTKFVDISSLAGPSNEDDDDNDNDEDDDNEEDDDVDDEGDDDDYPAKYADTSV